jgi:ketopantoate hydroxymethyltransferase
MPDSTPPEAVIDAEVVSDEEWQRVQQRMTEEKLAAEAEKIAAGIRTNQVIGVIVHGEISVEPQVFNVILGHPAGGRIVHTAEDVIRNAQELLLAKLDAVTKKG